MPKSRKRGAMSASSGKDTRFKPGQSGNPKGRPRKSPDLLDEIDRALARSLPVNEAGKRKRMTKKRAGATQFANKFAGGDFKVLKEVLANERARLQQRAAAVREGDDVVFDTEVHHLTIQNIVRRIRAIDPTDLADAENPETKGDDPANAGEPESKGNDDEPVT